MKDKLTYGEKGIDEELLAHQKDQCDQEQWDLHLLNIPCNYIYLAQVFHYINND